MGWALAYFGGCQKHILKQFQHYGARLVGLNSCFFHYYLLLPMPHIFFLVKISFVPVNSCLETTFLQYRMSSGIMELSNSLIYGNRLCCGSLEIANAKLKFSGKQQVHFKFKEVTLLLLEIFNSQYRNILLLKAWIRLPWFVILPCIIFLQPPFNRCALFF